MFIKVDLPAPFSPSSACTSPARMSKSMSALATTPGKLFPMPRMSTNGTCSAAARSVLAAASRAGINNNLRAMRCPPGWLMLHVETGDALHWPAPVHVELVGIHLGSGRDAHLALGIGDRSDERAVAFEHALAHLVDLGGDVLGHVLAPAVAVGALAERQELRGAVALPGALD